MAISRVLKRKITFDHFKIPDYNTEFKADFILLEKNAYRFNFLMLKILEPNKMIADSQL